MQAKHKKLLGSILLKALWAFVIMTTVVYFLNEINNSLAPNYRAALEERLQTLPYQMSVTLADDTFDANEKGPLPRMCVVSTKPIEEDEVRDKAPLNLRFSKEQIENSLVIKHNCDQKKEFYYYRLEH